MRPMSVREMDALCYERGIEFDPAEVPLELAELAHGIVGQPAWEGRSLAQELYERRAAERRKRRKVPEWFSVQDLLPEPWERAARVRPDRCGPAGRRWAAGTTRSNCRVSSTVIVPGLGAKTRDILRC